MKKLTLFTALCVLPMLAHSANWTPVFSHLEVGGKKGHAHAFELLLTNISRLPTPYRHDMLPERNFVKNGVQYTEIPLKNATLYGLPIANYTIYEQDYDITGSFITFKPMSNQQYQQLKRKKFKPRSEEDNGGPCGLQQPVIHKNKGKVYLEMYTGC